jgi:SecD/SecF fusion protein
VSPDALLADLTNAEVVAVNPRADGITSERFQVKTSISDADLVQTEIVSVFDDVVDSQPALSFTGVENESRRAALVFPVLDPSLGANFDNELYTNDVSAYQGGVVIVAENLDPSPNIDTLRDRLEYVRRQADFASSALGRTFEILVLEGDDEAVETAAIVVRDQGFDAALDPDRWERFAQEEWDIARTALGNAQTLAGVESFSPEIAATFRNQAIVAVALSFMLITMYIWARFGSVRYSLAALSCLVHDVIIAIGLIALAEIIYEKFPGAAAIGIQPFKIDLGLIAAILTIIGYSLNDTIIILDRIRENRGKLAYASKEVVNLSINQTISRTLITSTTTLLALITMFVIGGEGIASFTYALICGVVIGTYSSIAVAAPLVYTSKIPEAARTFRDRYASRDGGDSDGATAGDPLP